MAHLTSEQGYTIFVMLEKKISQSEIAATMPVKVLPNSSSFFMALLMR